MSKRFLISRLSALGDVVHTLPVAAALKAGFPDCEIHWAISPAFKDLPLACANVDKVFPVKPGFHPKTWPSFEDEYDIAFDMQGLSKSAIVVGRAKAKDRLGYHWQREVAWLFSKPVLPSGEMHVVDQYVDIARFAGGIADEAQFGLSPKPEALDSVRAKLSEAGLGESFIVLNAGAGWATKRWPAVHFGMLTDSLHDLGLKCVLIGGKAKADQDAAREVCHHAKHKPINLLGQTSVAELIGLLSMATVHVGGDTGSSHISAALKTPAVGLYGITDPKRTCPYGQIERCLHRPRLADITSEDVLAKIKEIIA